MQVNEAMGGVYASTELSEDEERLDAWFLETRDAYITTHVAAEDFPPHLFFYDWQGRSDVTSDGTFELLKRMPKGAALHLHR